MRRGKKIKQGEEGEGNRRREGLMRIKNVETRIVERRGEERRGEERRGEGMGGEERSGEGE